MSYTGAVFEYKVWQDKWNCLKGASTTWTRWCRRRASASTRPANASTPDSPTKSGCSTFPCREREEKDQFENHTIIAFEDVKLSI